MAYVKIFSGSIVLVQHVKQLLQEQGIEPIVKDNANAASMAGFGAVVSNFQELFVHLDQKSQAANILKHLS